MALWSHAHFSGKFPQVFVLYGRVTGRIMRNEQNTDRKAATGEAVTLGAEWGTYSEQF